MIILQTPLHYAASSTHGGICLEIMVTEGANTKAQVLDPSKHVQCRLGFLHKHSHQSTNLFQKLIFVNSCKGTKSQIIFVSGKIVILRKELKIFWCLFV